MYWNPIANMSRHCADVNHSAIYQTFNRPHHYRKSMHFILMTGPLSVDKHSDIVNMLHVRLSTVWSLRSLWDEALGKKCRNKVENTDISTISI